MNRKLICLAVVAGIGATVAMAEDLFVKVPFVYVRQGKGAIYPIVATVDKGAVLTTLGHETPWVKVQAPPDDKNQVATGYVGEVALQTNKPDMSGFAGTGVASQVTVGDAPKGMGPDSVQYSKAKNQDRGPLEALKRFRAKITFEEFKEFADAGKVGIGQPNH